MVLAALFGMPTSKKKSVYVSPYSAGATPPPVPESSAEPMVLPADASPEPSGVGQPIVTIYTLEMTADATNLRAVQVPLDAAEDTPEKQAVAAIEKMATAENSPLPEGTRATSVKIQDDLATVDLNPAFLKNFKGGDLTESLALSALTTTLGQFPGVKRVQVLVEGKKVETLGGHALLKEPLPVASK